MTTFCDKQIYQTEWHFDEDTLESGISVSAEISEDF